MHMGPWTGSSRGRGIGAESSLHLGIFRGTFTGSLWPGLEDDIRLLFWWHPSLPPFLLHGWMGTIPLEWSIPLWPLTGRVPSLPDRLQNDHHLLTHLPQSCLSSHVHSSRRDEWCALSSFIIGGPVKSCLVYFFLSH